MITHEIDLNVSQPNNKQFIHINQGEYDSVKIVAHIWAKNKPYTIDADKIRIEGKLSSGSLLFDGDSAIKIVKENDTTVSFILTKPIAASVGSFNFSLLFYKGSDVLKKTFPFTIRVSGNPANNVKSDAVLDGVIKKLEQQEQEYNQLATVAKTGDYNDLINKPSGLTVTTNLFKPTFSALISGTKYKILLNSDNTMDVRNNGADSTMIKIGEANVKKGITYKIICYAPDYENLNNTVLSIGDTNVGAQDYYEYIPKADGIIDISIGFTAGNVGTYTIYPMVTPNLAATIDDYVPYTGLYNEINWDVSDLSRGIFRHPILTLYDGNERGVITYDGTKNSMTLEFYTSSGGGTADLICGDLVAGATKLSNLTVGDWLPKGKSDIVLKRYDMNDEGETYVTDTISLYDFYTNTSKKFDDVDRSIENLYEDTGLYLRKAGDSMTGALRIYVDKIQGSAATGDDPIVFAITPEQNVSLFTVSKKMMTRNGSTVFSNYQSSSNTTHINTSNIKFWKSFFAAGSNTDEITLTLPSKTGSLALVEDLPSNYFDTDSSHDANTVLAAPDGANGKAGFRKLVAADIPALDYLPYKDKTISNEVYFANDVFWGDSKNGIQFIYDVDKKLVSFDYFTSDSGGNAGGTTNFICNNLSSAEGVFSRDVKVPIYQMDDEGESTLIDTISLKSLYKSFNNLSVNNNTVTIDQFGQQTDSFTLNQNTDITISLIHDDTKLDVAGGEMSGDLYVAGTIYANGGVVGDLTGNAATATSANSAAYTTQLLGVNGDNAPYPQIEGNFIRAVWKGDESRWLLKAGSYGCSVDKANSAGLLSYAHDNEINFKGGTQSAIWFNYRNADTDAQSPITTMTYKFANYSGSTASTVIDAARFAGKADNAGVADSSNLLAQNATTDFTAPGGLQWMNISNGNQGCNVDANDTPTDEWWYINRNRHTNKDNDFYTDVAIPFNHNSIYYKVVRNSSVANGGWVKVLDSLNYTEYCATAGHTHGLTHNSFTSQFSETSGGWDLIGGNNGFILKSIRTNADAPNWSIGNFSAAIAFGGADTKGIITIPYSYPGVKFAGGNGDSPNWYFDISGTSGNSYNLDNFLTSHQDISGKLDKSGGTITGRIVKVTDGSWIGDRDRAVVYSSTPPDGGYGCVACMPTKHGSWTMGNLGGVEHLIFNYVPDANYSANKNESIHVYLRPTEGTIALTSDIPSSLPASDVYAWAKASSKPSYSWGEISGRPTALSSFTNDSGFITGSDSRLTNARPASDVYSWAKASSKPSYTWTEISNKPDMPSISKDTPTRTNWTISSEYNCVVYRIGDFCLAVVAVTGTIYPRQWLPAAKLSKDFTPHTQSSIVICSVSGSDHMECMVTKDGYIKMWWSGSSPASSANICIPYYLD